MEGVPDGRPLDRRPSATSSTSRGQSALSTPQRSQRRPSRTQQPQEITKVRLCVLGFFHANHYEGPYGKHIAVIIHSGNAVLILGVLLSAIAFLIEQPSGPIDGVRVFAIVILTLGITTTISTATVYARAHQNAITGENGRVNLHSRDILIQIALGFTVVMILMGAVLLPLSFSMSSRQVLFEYFKVVGFAYVGLGLISFIIITMYSKFSHKNRSSPNRGSNSTRNSTRTPRRQRSRANSGIPEIRVESDTASDTGAGSDISDIPNSARRTSVVTPSIIICPPFPPPYRGMKVFRLSLQDRAFPIYAYVGCSWLMNMEAAANEF